MGKRERAILFIITAILFVATATALIVYSQGYRLDWEHKKITKTGGFFIKAPPRALITINEKTVKKVNLLGSGVFIPNFLPREYTVRVYKPGFWEWEKTLFIEPGRTTEARSILLVQKVPRQDLLSDGVEDFLPAPDQRNIAIKKSGGLWMLDTENKKEVLLTAQLFRLISWSPDSQYLLLEEPSGRNILFHVKNGIVIPLPGTAENFQWLTNESSKILFLSPASRDLTLYDLQNQEGVVLFKNVAAYTPKEAGVLFIDAATRMLYEGNLAGTIQKQLTLTPLEENDIHTVEIFPYGDFVFLRDGANRLLRFEKSSASLDEVGSNVQHIVFSSLGKSVLFTTPNEIWVLYLKDILIQPFRYRDQKDLIVRLSEKIEDAAWYTKDNEHIIFRVRNNVRITELDGRDKRNTPILVEMSNASQDNSMNPAIRYSENNNLLYILDGGKLYSVDMR